LQSTLTELATQVFARHFSGVGDPRLSLAPGRVNLIGEHTDYNDGFVLPMAIGRHVAVAFRETGGRLIRVWSEAFQEETVIDLDSIGPGSHSGWSAYVAGMCWAFETSGRKVTGMDAAIVTDVPIGAGVSSSAALEVSFGMALSEAGGIGLAPADIAELSHLADNDFVGIPSGIMDQYASALCRHGHALLIDCRSREVSHIPVPAEVAIVVMDTGKRRGLVDSEYADRVAACRRVARAIAEEKPGVRALRDVTEDDLIKYGPRIASEDVRKALHVVSENERTLRAVQLLRAGNAAGFGEMMDQSHASLRDLYEVSCRELDIAVEIAQNHPACLGARMTGGGFGGCALALVAREALDEFVASTSAQYMSRSGISGSFYSAEPAAGVSSFGG